MTVGDIIGFSYLASAPLALMAAGAVRVYKREAGQGDNWPLDDTWWDSADAWCLIGGLSIVWPIALVAWAAVKAGKTVGRIATRPIVRAARRVREREEVLRLSPEELAERMERKP